MKAGVIIASHNSESTLKLTVESLKNQTDPPSQILIIDSGSNDTKYVKELGSETVEIAFMPNIGFSRANNLGYEALDPSVDLVFFVNPDVILPKEFIENAKKWLSECGNPKVGAFTGLLLEWNVRSKKPSGRIDSSGIFSTWYGKWYDREQKSLYEPEKTRNSEPVEALSGALIIAKKEALETLDPLFDESFFCYKEDIDFSIRLMANGWDLMHVPSLIAYHARGWQDRRAMPRKLRLLSAKNELTIHIRRKNPIKILYSGLKWLAVWCFDL